MEKIKEFLSIEYGSGDDSGFGYGDGSGYGCGDGSGDGYGDGSGYGCGDGSGDGCGDGSGDDSGFGFGDGSGYGYGYGDGSGDGCGDGSGDGDGIKAINGDIIYQIDSVPTIIKQVRNNVAKGYILNDDLSLTPCYIVKGHNKFAHGESLKKAMEDLENKFFEDMDTDEAIEMFLKEFSDLNKKYPAKDFYIWHNRLTGSCEMGRNSFVRNGGYNLETDSFTVQEFINITRNAFGGDVIATLEKKH